MDEITAAVCDMLRTNAADMRAAITGLSVEQLNTPPLKVTSSLAVLVEHTVTGTLALVDSALTGKMDRGRYMGETRPAAFATAGADEQALHASLDRLNALADRLEKEPSVDGYAGNVDITPAAQPPRTRLWSLIHAIEHLREHVGHAQLSRQMIEQR